MSSFWLDRPTLDRRHRPGGRLARGRLVEAEAGVVCLVRGDVRDQALLRARRVRDRDRAPPGRAEPPTCCSRNAWPPTPRSRDNEAPLSVLDLLFGWRPLFDLEGGLRRTIDWYRDFLAGGPGRPAP